ncbi:hypothetical protein D3C76_1525830 [compost metagenome]
MAGFGPYLAIIRNPIGENHRRFTLCFVFILSQRQNNRVRVSPCCFLIVKFRYRHCTKLKIFGGFPCSCRPDTRHGNCGCSALEIFIKIRIIFLDIAFGIQLLDIIGCFDPLFFINSRRFQIVRY